MEWALLLPLFYLLGLLIGHEKGVKQGKRELIYKACEWLKDNWRKHVWLDGDNIIHFGLWENDFRKAMEE